MRAEKGQQLFVEATATHIDTGLFAAAAFRVVAAGLVSHYDFINVISALAKLGAAEIA